MSEHRYRLLYSIERKPEGVAKQDVPPNTGACDAMLLASIIYPANGSLSIMFVSGDGRTDKDLDDNEWFKVWSLLSKRLAESTTLADNKRELCDVVFQTIAAAVRGGRE